ncbi:MAG: hypothetical protein J5857_01620 [Treponema sp.]|nr:hypothetical protein [Treponema sp.]
MDKGYFKSKNRLTFKRKIMEEIDDDEIYVNVIESLGVFRISKRDFYKNFDNVVASQSWIQGIYSYKKIPSWANKYLSLNNNTNNVQATEITSRKTKMTNKKDNPDIVGDEIREKIREIGKLWYNSPHKLILSEDACNYWAKLINEWSNDESLPLVVRKETKRRGESINHPSGREIIFSDNSFATWIICNVIENVKFTLKEIKKLLENDEIPFMYIATKELKEKAKYKKQLGDNETIGWRLCHKEAIGFYTKEKIESMDIDAIKQHFLKYANPKNIFLLPIEIGFLGELKEFIEEQK